MIWKEFTKHRSAHDRYANDWIGKESKQAREK